MAVQKTDNTLSVVNQIDNGIGLTIRMMLEDIYAGATPYTPRKTGDLRNRVLRQMDGNYRGTITWETPYAGVQEQGFRQGKNGIIPFVHYTTPNTGPNYARDAVIDTAVRLPEYLDKVGIL